METRTVEQVESWSTRSVADGYAGLRELSDGEFSGAVRGGGAWLFMLNGRIVGVFEGSLDDFEGTDGTAYAAPHPSLPLLFSMQEQGGDTRAQYYTNDTPLSEVDSTLSEGKFTGFVELSENVLSGDYYVAYYGGRSLSVAFVGASEQVVTGDDAFERAADEVGIYEVTDVDVEVTDVPEPEDDDPDAASGGTSGGGATAGGSSGSAATGGPAGGSSAQDATGSESETGSTAGAASNATAGATDSSDSNDSPSTADSDAAGADASARSERSPDPSRSERPAQGASEGSPSASRQSDDAGASGRRRDAGADGSSDSGTADSADASAADSASTGGGTAAANSSGTDAAAADQGRAAEPGRTTDASREATADRTSRETTADRTTSTRDPSGASADASTDRSDAGTGGSDARDAGSTGSESNAADGEAEWRETTTIPSLDPDLSDGPDEPPADSQAGATAAGDDRGRAAESGDHSRSGRRSTEERTSESGADGATGASAGGATARESASDSGSGESSDARARIRTLRKQLEQRKQQVEQLKERLSSLESERDEYKRERDALGQEVERLEAKLDGASSTGGSSVGRQLGEADAFDGTNLFVRYDSKGEATLDEAAKGQVDRGDVNANLRLEHHTQFEAGEASVDGEPFEAFLADSFEYEFASWVVEELLYEIRDTGQRNALKELYEAVPKIDRVDLHGTVSAGDTQEDTRQESFDVIMRDRMGEPLVVADLNDSRDPTTGEMMGSLVDAASGVSRAHDELAGAFQVTASFFEPEALETAEAATSDGLLSREKRASFVKLSRKRGYHLCLVESRGGDFHLNVPEL